MSLPNAMIVSDLLEIRQSFVSILGQSGLTPIAASNLKEAQTILNRHSVSLIFCCDESPECGLDVLIGQTSELPQAVPVVVVSRIDDWRRFLDFLRAGAFDYVLYPPSRREIERILQNVLGTGSLTMAATAS